MRRNFVTAVVAAIIVAGFFAACEKKTSSSSSNNNGNSNGNGTDTTTTGGGGGGGSTAFVIEAANVANSSSNIATVKAIVENGEEEEIIVVSPYKNNGFKLTLPQTLNDKYLELLEDLDIEFDRFGFVSYFGVDIKISDNTAKGYVLYDVEAYDKDDDYIGYFIYINDDDNGDEEKFAMGYWIYVDKNVTIKGNFQLTQSGVNVSYKCDLNLKKGWNAVYESFNAKESTLTAAQIISTQKPSSFSCKWNFYDEADYTKSTAKRKTNLTFDKTFIKKFAKLRK